MKILLLLFPLVLPCPNPNHNRSWLLYVVALYYRYYCTSTYSAVADVEYCMWSTDYACCNSYLLVDDIHSNTVCLFAFWYYCMMYCILDMHTVSILTPDVNICYCTKKLLCMNINLSKIQSRGIQEMCVSCCICRNIQCYISNNYPKMNFLYHRFNVWIGMKKGHDNQVKIFVCCKCVKTFNLFLKISVNDLHSL